jgi:signal transduction histidine kinase
MRKITAVLLTVISISMMGKSQTTQENTSAMRQPLAADSSTQIMALVGEAAALINALGEEAFRDFRLTGSLWRQGETYIFVLDSTGHMLVHPDALLEGKNQLGLTDINGKPIVRGLLEAATATSDKGEGWYHYQWPVPGGLLPRWKSSYVRRVKAPSGKHYVVGCGSYNDRMERIFVVDIVKNAIGKIKKEGMGAFAAFHDTAGPFFAKDAYIFVIDQKGIDLVNPAFPNLEGRNIMDLKDSQGRYLVRDMFKAVEKSGSGWVEYLWPKPGESASTLKSSFVGKAKFGDSWVLVGCGVYLADAPKTISKIKKMTGPELMVLVRDAAKALEQRGEKAYPEFRKTGSKWLHDETYLYIWTMDGTRVFHATEPMTEGEDVRGLKDVRDRPLGRMILEAGASSSGEGWVHYMYPVPGDIFPTWKSAFVKRVTFPSGQQYIVGCGIYNMEMDEAFIEDVVNHAATVVEEKGVAAFDILRDKKGPFFFMDIYVFLDNLEGVELVNPAQPSIEGKNMIQERDLAGKLVMQEYLEAAIKQGHAWVSYSWYRPGENTPAQKHTYVRMVKHGNDHYVIGAGYYESKGRKHTDK